jgi:hypothetical protein
VIFLRNGKRAVGVAQVIQPPEALSLKPQYCQRKQTTTKINSRMNS